MYSLNCKLIPLSYQLIDHESVNYFIQIFFDPTVSNLSEMVPVITKPFNRHPAPTATVLNLVHVHLGAWNNLQFFFCFSASWSSPRSSRFGARLMRTCVIIGRPRTTRCCAVSVHNIPFIGHTNGFRARMLNGCAELEEKNETIHQPLSKFCPIWNSPVDKILRQLSQYSVMITGFCKNYSFLFWKILILIFNHSFVIFDSIEI